jgi:hypothetical protein
MKAVQTVTVQITAVKIATILMRWMTVKNLLKYIIFCCKSNNCWKP